MNRTCSTTLLLGALMCLSMLPGFAQAQCMDAPAKRINRRDSALHNIIEARSRLAAYELELALARQFPTIPEHLTLLNQVRGEILWIAASAYYLAGPRDYPQDPQELAAMLDGLTIEELDHLQWPQSLQALVDCGILPHLPASPHATGAYLSALPEQPQPGDVYYEARATTKDYLVPAGGLESCILVVFDQHTAFNSDDLYDDTSLQEEYPSDVTLYIPPGKYDTICCVNGQDVEHWD
jgi:hypothetical protein